MNPFNQMYKMSSTPAPAVNNKRGCSDGPEPENYTDEQLSRVEDALNSLRTVHQSLRDKAWHAMPHDLKMEYVYSRWTYTPAK